MQVTTAGLAFVIAEITLSLSTCCVYVYNVSKAGVSDAFVIAVSIAACLLLIPSLHVVMLLGISVDFSVFLVIYQSVWFNKLLAWDFTDCIKLYFNPLVATVFVSAPSGALPSSICCWVQLTSAWALAVAVP